MSSPEYRERSAVLEFPRRAGFVAALDRRQLTICRKIASSPSPHAPLFCGEHRGSERLARYPWRTKSALWTGLPRWPAQSFLRSSDVGTDGPARSPGRGARSEILPLAVRVWALEGRPRSSTAVLSAGRFRRLTEKPAVTVLSPHRRLRPPRHRQPNRSVRRHLRLPRRLWPRRRRRRLPARDGSSGGII
jgi:hypothetical protein